MHFTIETEKFKIKYTMENQENEDYEIIKPKEVVIKKKKNRALMYQEEMKFDALNLSPEALVPLARFLNSTRGNHVDEIYFSRDGKHHLGCFKEKDKSPYDCYEDTEYKGKLYCRIEIQNFEIGGKPATKMVDKAAREIIKIMPAEEIIKTVYEWEKEQEKPKSKNNK